MTYEEQLRMECFVKAREMERQTSDVSIPGGSRGRAEFVMTTAERLYRFVKTGEMPPQEA